MTKRIMRRKKQLNFSARKTQGRLPEKQILAVLKKVAYEYGTSKNGIQLSEEIGVDRKTIYAWAHGLRAVGVDVPKMTRAGIYLSAAKAISEERPELILKKK